jgi:hypothetical protein
MSAIAIATSPAPRGNSTSDSLVIEIGGVAVSICSRHEAFLELLRARYAGFIFPAASPQASFEVEIHEPALPSPIEVRDEDLEVALRQGLWEFRRGDFHATWDPVSSLGHITQTCNPFSIDSVLRILHSVLLAPRGGLLIHAASAIRHGKAFLFAGISGAGKTTISRLAPRDATLLTDEISYVRRNEVGNGQNAYRAWGTPFAGELAKSGENVSAPLSVIYLLEQGKENRVMPIAKIDAVRSLMRHVLFFAEDTRLVEGVFDSVRLLVDMVPVRTLMFRPEADVWEIIGSL